MIDYDEAHSVDEKTLRRLWDWAVLHDTSGERMLKSPPKSKEEIITQLVWIGIIGGMRGRGWT